MMQATFGMYIASKEIVTGKFHLFEVTEYIHIRQYTGKKIFISNSSLDPFERQVADSTR